MAEEWIRRIEMLRVLGIKDGGAVQKLINTKQFRTRKLDGQPLEFERASVEAVLARRQGFETTPTAEPENDSEEWVKAAEAARILKSRPAYLNFLWKKGALRRKKGANGRNVFPVSQLRELANNKLVRSSKKPKRQPLKRQRKWSLAEINQVVTAEHSQSESLEARARDFMAFAREQIPNLYRMSFNFETSTLDIERRMINTVNLTRAE